MQKNNMFAVVMKRWQLQKKKWCRYHRSQALVHRTPPTRPARRRRQTHQSVATTTSRLLHTTLSHRSLS